MNSPENHVAHKVILKHIPARNRLHHAGAHPAPGESPVAGPGDAAAPIHEERRHRKEDGWSRAVRYIAIATYILLILNLFIFVGIASQDYNAVVGAQVGDVPKSAEPPPIADLLNPRDHNATAAEPGTGLDSAKHPGRAAYRQAFLPLMAVGFLVGVAGLFIHRIRTRRRHDRKYLSQFLCIIVSSAGLALYFLFSGS